MSVDIERRALHEEVKEVSISSLTRRRIDSIWLVYLTLFGHLEGNKSALQKICRIMHNTICQRTGPSNVAVAHRAPDGIIFTAEYVKYYKELSA